MGGGRVLVELWSYFGQKSGPEGKKSSAARVPRFSCFWLHGASQEVRGRVKSGTFQSAASVPVIPPRE